MRRITGVIAIALGVGLIAVPFALSLFSRTAAAERVTDRFRHMMSEEGLVELRTDFETVRGTGEELIGSLLPRLADDLGMSEDELSEFLQAEFPATATGVAEVPGVLTFVDPVIDTLEADAARFRAADSIPVGDVPLTVGPWVFLGLGIAFVVVGAVVLTGTRGMVAVALGLGVVVGAAPFVVSFPQKASDGNQVAEVARIGLSQDGADKAQYAMGVLDAMFAEIQDGLLPAVEQRLDLSPGELDELLATQFPKVRLGLERWAEIEPKGHSLADKQTASVDDFADADRIPFFALPWLLVGAGAILALASAAALVGPRSKRPADVTVIDLDDSDAPERELATARRS